MANSPPNRVGSSGRAPIDVGTVIADTYTIEALIGRGGMGSVFLASHNRLPGKQVAIKLLHAELQDAEVIARFKREAQIASKLNHPNIVTVHDFNVTPDGTPYLVLELLQGESLAQRLTQGAMPLATVFSIARQVGSALAAAHREGIVHRDLKPQNIFLVPTEIDGKLVEIAKVLDFGISKMRGSTTVKTQESTLLGTPQYMAPEQAKGDHAAVDPRTDVFALGAIVYEMLAGHPAFSGENIPEVVFKVVYEQPKPLVTEAPTIPPGVVATVEQAMAKAQDERFDSVSLFVEQLTGEKVMGVRSPSLPPTDSSPRVKIGAKEAYDRTVASGDHGKSPTVAAPPKLVSVHAATVDSLAPAPATIAAPAAPPPARSRLPLIAVAIGGAAIGAVVLYFATRGGDAPTTAPPPADAAQVALAIDAAAPLPVAFDAAPPVEAPHDAAPVVADAAPVVADAAPVVADARAPKPHHPPDGSGDPDPAPVRQAYAAYARGDFKTAQTIANELLYSQTPLRPFQRARAIAVHAAASCKLHEFEKGKIGYRQLAGFRGLRAIVIAGCGQQVTVE